jgi:hypothetical protein
MIQIVVVRGAKEIGTVLWRASARKLPPGTPKRLGGSGSSYEHPVLGDQAQIGGAASRR